jgi:hypothetical protein
VADLKRASLRRKWSTIPKARRAKTKTVEPNPERARPKQKKKKETTMNSLTQFKKISILPFLIALMLFALAQNTQAVSPPPDGGYPGGNTAEGDSALFHLDTSQGVDNTADGFQALYSNTTGQANTATGDQALYSNTTGYANTATGASALISNTTGNQNTATGLLALLNNTIGSGNTASGFVALPNNTTGNNNTATGFQALYHNTTINGVAGGSNTANGWEALLNNTTGSGNIAVGASAGKHLTTGSNNIDIGALGVAGDSNTIRIGKRGVQTKAFIQGIHGVAVTGSTVVVNANGQLGVLPSSKRFKDEIKPMDKASGAILALKPVTFRYKQDIDSKCTPQFGLVAEEVAKVNPNLVSRDAKGDIYTVRYDAVNAMLLNEFLKEHHQVQDLKTIVVEQQKQIEALTAGLRKVSAQIETGKAAPQMVLNNP